MCRDAPPPDRRRARLLQIISEEMTFKTLHIHFYSNEVIKGNVWSITKLFCLNVSTTVNYKTEKLTSVYEDNTVTFNFHLAGF